MDGQRIMDVNRERDVDCQVFGDQLDALVKEELPEEGMRQLRLHAGVCPECAMQLRVQEELASSTLAELEARVPEELLASLWTRVEKEVRERDEEGAAMRAPSGVPGEGGKVKGRWGWEGGPRFGWLVPTLAAATLILCVSTGFLAVELNRVRDLETNLAQQVAEQQGWLAALSIDRSADPVARTAALAGRNPWLRALSREERISVGGLRALLERMPGDRIVMTQPQVDAALRSRASTATPLFREVLVRVEGEEGVRARDLLRALEGSDVSPELTVPTSELLDLLS